MENVEQRVKKIVAEQLGVNEAEIKNESSFVDDLGADSLDTVELVMALEEEFETEIPDEEAEKITTVQQATDYTKAQPKPKGTRRRVVVTGLGIVCPIGNTVQEAWDSALAGKPGITRITRFDPSRLSSQIAGEVKGFDVSPYMSPKEARRMDIFIHYGMAAGLQAWRDCGMQATPENGERIGVNFGSGIGGLPLIETMHHGGEENGPRRISPFFIPGSIINMIAGLLSIEVGAKGPNLAMVTACTTSTHCIGEAAKSIRYGDAEMMIAGGAEAVLTELAVGGFASARAPCTRNDAPAGARRAAHAQRRPGRREPSLGQGARRLRVGRRRRRSGARRIRARPGARRENILRAGRLRRLGGRPSHDGSARGRRRRVSRHAQRPEGRGPRELGSRLHQRARHLHAARRRRRDESREAAPRRARRQGRRELDQVDDRAPARRRRRRRSGFQRACAARPGFTAHHQSAHA